MNPDKEQLLNTILEGTDWTHICAACDALEQVPGDDVTQALLQCTRYDQVPVRMAATLALGKRSPERLPPGLAACLYDHALVVQRAAVIALSLSTDPAAREQLWMALQNHREPDVRTLIINLYGEKVQAGFDATPLFHALRKDPHWEVREQAAKVLGLTPLLIEHTKVVTLALVTAVEKDHHAIVKTAALRSLRQRKEPEVSNLLIKVLTTPGDTGLRTEALFGLVLRIGPSVTAAIIEVLPWLLKPFTGYCDADRLRAANEEVFHALASYESDELSEALINHLSHEDERIRASAQYVVAKRNHMGGPLLKALQADPGSSLLREALVARYKLPST